MHFTQPDETWISAAATRGWCVQDPILNWLEIHGRARGFLPDNKYDGYDPDTDMLRFLREKGKAFESAVLACLEEQFQVQRIADRLRIEQLYKQRAADQQVGLLFEHARRADSYALDPQLHEETLEAMENGTELLYQPVLWDPVHRTFGVPDLLVRSDVLNRLVSHPAISDVEASVPCSLCSGPYHYRVVVVKFTNLDLNSKGWLGNDGSDRRRKAQLLVYNRALAHMQGYEPQVAYVIGRGFAFKSKGQSFRGNSCFDRLGPADMTDPDLHSLVKEAVAWIMRLRGQGHEWHALPNPSVPELHPNMSNKEDAPWHLAKKEIAEQTDELTLLWRVTPNNRPKALAAGVACYSDPECHSSIFGLSEGYATKLQHIIDINRSECLDRIQPQQIGSASSEWRNCEPLEFFVDFETVSSLDDDFTKIPQKGGQTLIYMIGCGHVENGLWQFQCFTCDDLTVASEGSIIDRWHKHMHDVKQRLWPEGNPKLFHWSHAEESFYSRSYFPALDRHDADWPELNWFDFLAKVVREEPVVVKGGLAFGLKAVAKAMHKQGLVETDWTNGPGDGLGAMVGAWRCDSKAREQGCVMLDLPLMQSIEEYNEVDCRAMQEIIYYLRANH